MPENPALMNSASTQPRTDYTTPSSPSKSGGWRRYLSSVLIIVGTLILSYVASQYYGMYREQKELEQEWAKQQNKGDSIMVQRNGETLRFEVTGKKIVEPDDLSVLKQSDDSRLTLITCYPIYYIGPAPQRLVVFSKLAEDKKAAASGASEAVR
jgi:hypothetical protein